MYVVELLKKLRQTGVSPDVLDNDRLKIELVNDICLLAISGWIINNIIFNLPSEHYLETIIAIPQLVFFILPILINRTSKSRLSIFALIIPACITSSILYAVAGDNGYYELIFLFIFIGVFYLIDNPKWKWALWLFAFVLWLIPYQLSQNTTSIFDNGQLNGLTQVLFVVSAIGIFLVSEKVINQIGGYTDKYNTKILQQKKNLNLLKAKNEELEVKLGELKVKNGEIEIFFNLSSAYLKRPTRELIRLSKQLEKNKLVEITPDSKECFSIINQSAGRMNELIEAVFEYSRISSKNPKQEVDCEQILEEVLIDLKAEIDKKNTQVLWSTMPTVNANKVELRMLFQNLISNAIKYSKKDTSPIIKISSVDKETHWLFKVKDNGLGIPKNHQSMIFKMFHKLNNSIDIPGTGIGLANCKKIVNNHKGKIWVDSEFDQGAVFLFTIKKGLN